MTVQEVKLFEKWMNMQSVGVEKTDVFEILNKDTATAHEARSTKARIDDLPPEFFDFFMVIKAS